MNFDDIADAYWFDTDVAPSARPAQRQRQRQFGSLKRAVLFVMWNLPESARRNAWITTKSAHYSVREILGLFTKIYDEV